MSLTKIENGKLVDLFSGKEIMDQYGSNPKNKVEEKTAEEDQNKQTSVDILFGPYFPGGNDLT